MSWQVDKSHSHINFTVRHMMISKVRGEFTNFDATIAFDENNPTNTTVDVTIYADSINTRDAQRDGHLRSPDFLSAAEYPIITFKGKKVEQFGEDRGRLTGDLTIRGVAREVALDVEYSGLMKNPFGGVSAGFAAKTTINRKEWGLTWNVALETGGWLVSDQIAIEIDLELVKVAETEAVAAAA